MTHPAPQKAALDVVTSAEFVRLVCELEKCCKSMRHMSTEDAVDYGYIDGAEQIQRDMASIIQSALDAKDGEIAKLTQELAIYKALIERVQMQQADKDFLTALRDKPFKE